MNLAEAFAATARAQPDRVACAGRAPLTYGELDARARAAAVRLAAHAGPADRVAVIAGNDVAFVVAYLAVLRIGAVVVPMNTGSPTHELVREFDAVAPAVVIAAPAFADAARRAVAQHESTNTVLVLDGNETTDDEIAPVHRDADDLAVLLFTAGTAGAPKPAMLTHGSLLANLEQMQSHPGLRITPDDVALAVLPLFHVFGLNVVLGLSLYAGASVSLVEEFHPVETLTRMRDDRVTVVAAVPAIYAAWLALEDAAVPAAAFGAVRLAVSGATTLPAEIVRAMRDRFGVIVHDGYGLTEASPVVTTTAVTPEPRPGSVGPPLPGVDVQLLDVDGKPVLHGDPGEIVVRGPNVFAGYWNDASATDSVLADGWLHTGDIAVADDDGWLTLVDRAKDVIIVSGFNVYPGEVEDALHSHPDVDDVAVIGEAHPRSGETVVAYVVARPGATVDPVELVRHARRALARYKVPTRVEFVDELPRTLAGKLVRRELSARRRPDATANPA